ncbi:flavodoxin [Limosilactobacillus sp.]|uniref:flavodoxin n=1 Tax=Limosilactobacillus sp. TaxID=2773925 RepID=UPI00345EDA33
MTKKVLVAYYSMSGNTARIAKTVAQKMGADLHEIKEVPGTFPSDMFAANDVFKQQLADGKMPALTSHLDNADNYDLILIGGPVWDVTVASPVRTFISSQLHGFKGQVADFSSAASDTGGYENDFKELARQADLSPISNGLHVNGSRVTNGQLQKWSQALGL